ncbi:hypothetical protein [Streptomyces lushanensis]|uniref:hypothetical protein n=1 Tax=Streptomyces lushanensis TaxID=1434255 RepID=UPI0008345D9E|nr:hypothetical protein [Streptomyces lushanensis]
MTRNKEYLAVVTLAAAVLTVPTGAYALTSATASSATSPSAGAAQAVQSGQTVRADKASGIRLVAPGQRVKAAPGVRMWLTKEGKHWSIDGFEQFRSVVDGNIDTSRPGIGRQSEEAGDLYFHSGVYYGTRNAARVEITLRTGRVVPASMIELPGKPGWGAWYAGTELPPAADDGEGPNQPRDYLSHITLYDTTGRALAVNRSTLG